MLKSRNSLIEQLVMESEVGLSEEKWYLGAPSFITGSWCCGWGGFDAKIRCHGAGSSKMVGIGDNDCGIVVPSIHDFASFTQVLEGRA